ncbi:hypothetical protein [Schinkia azotoformans]|uniref:hypothetical protein n=1 Tax=Schinkia azotoformans TaxID=1454 RepID=UPI002DBA452F|nr:hypothetical protein [Schinkia azotoformans]MEC1718737.1 hypothetical protein [Schinkia azotoformans]MEC1742764.1 hypothetical protein [Schinkia azotoformans]MEC1748114.1 hypothetical protein [Schinkia azotoformans]MEC1760551.1 hypothetical protein [Schinkia azotoformans]MEC1769290.1 hypothetical protein [Schinkia azotoformans]
MIIFRRVEEAFRTTKSNLDTQLPEEELAIELEKMRLLSKIISYINSYQWLKHEQTRIKIREFLQSSYRYQEVAQKFGVTLNSLQVSVSYAAKKLEKQIGTALDLLLSGEIEAAEREFLLNTGQTVPSTWFLDGVLERLPQPNKKVSADLSVSERELRFLKLMTKKHIEEMVGTLDQDRMKHLLYILLQNDRSFISEREILIRFLNGELDVKQVVQRFKNDNIYAI